MKAAVTRCELCHRGNGTIDNAPHMVKGVRVVLCEDCSADRHRMREVERRVEAGEIK